MDKKTFLTADEIINLNKDEKNWENTARKIANQYSDLLKEVVDQQNTIESVNNNLINLVNQIKK